MAADSELPDDALEQVNRHMAGCTTCRQRFENHGELDMLLKNHLSHEPPEGYFDTLWPAVSERIEGGGGDSASVGGGGDDEEVVFKSSPAMDYLNIPERRPPTQKTVSEVAEAPPPEESSPWRWPVALMVSTGIVVVGWLAYKKMTPPPPRQPMAAVTQPAPMEEPSSMPATATAEPELADAGLQVAALSNGDGGGSVSEPGPSKAHPRRRRHRRGRHKSKAEEKAAPPPAAAPAKPKPAAKAAKPKPGKGSALDSLLDDAIGGKEVAKKKKAAAAPKPAASDLPEQLNMNQIRTAMNKVKGRVQACYDQYQVEGMANVAFSILGGGGISNVSIRGKFRGTDTGDCVVKAVKTARFPKFSGKKMTIKNYPFLLQ